jgi:hypothetical protein
MRISDRLSVLALAGLLSACNSAGGDGMVAGAQEEAQPVACRLDSGQSFADKCSAEWRDEGGDVRILILHHPDGGFRRLLVARDGKRVNVADGSETLAVATIPNGLVELSVGDRAYRLPAASLRAGAAR